MDDMRQLMRTFSIALNNIDEIYCSDVPHYNQAGGERRVSHFSSYSRQAERNDDLFNGEGEVLCPAGTLSHLCSGESGYGGNHETVLCGVCGGAELFLHLYEIRVEKTTGQL